MRQSLVVEACVVGFLLLLVHAAVDAVLDLTDTHPSPTLELFLAGAVGHVAFELIGLNAAFCQKVF